VLIENRRHYEVRPPPANFSRWRNFVLKQRRLTRRPEAAHAAWRNDGISIAK